MMKDQDDEIYLHCSCMVRFCIQFNEAKQDNEGYAYLLHKGEPMRYSLSPKHTMEKGQCNEMK